jgi:hypothetical protein
LIVLQTEVERKAMLPFPEYLIRGFGRGTWALIQGIGLIAVALWPFIRLAAAWLLLVAPGMAWIVYAITHVPPKECVEATGNCSQVITATLGVGGFVVALAWIALATFMLVKFNSWANQPAGKEESCAGSRT